MPSAVGAFDAGKLESFILEKMSKTRLPGLSIAVIADGEVVYARGFGFRDVESGLPATPRTVYGVGSVTKSFTALAVMQLAERGLLSLDDPVEKYVPLRLRPRGEHVRIRHLLTHTSGIPALAYAEALIRSTVGDDGAWLPVATSEDVIAFMRDAEGWAEARPGERFFYLNEGYVLLGHIVERVSGVRYEEYVRKNILEPLGMRRSYFTRSELEADPDRATPYLVGKEGRCVPSRYPYGITADGGLLSNVLDLSRYLRAMIGRGELEGVRVASEESVAEMEKPRVRLPYEVFGGESYGYGWVVVSDFMGYRLVGHSGSVLVSTAYVGYVPERRAGVAVLANASGYPLSYVGMYALALVLGGDPEELPPVKRDRVLDKLAGTYETYKGTHRVSVVRRGDFLYVEVKGRYTEESVPLVPEKLGEEEAVFFTFEAGKRIEAVFRIEGERVELLYERYKFRKVGGA